MLAQKCIKVYTQIQFFFYFKQMKLHSNLLKQYGSSYCNPKYLDTLSYLSNQFKQEMSISSANKIPSPHPSQSETKT